MNSKGRETRDYETRDVGLVPSLKVLRPESNRYE